MNNACEKTGQIWDSHGQRIDWVRQGSVLSPILFHAIMNKIFNGIREEIKEMDSEAFIEYTDYITISVKTWLETRLSH